jgi:alkylation response protein AidB-like acyl-CoA dehydrogenase
MPDATEARRHLQEWLKMYPDNFFLSDSNLQIILQRYLPPGEYDNYETRFKRAGHDAATQLDSNARLEDKIGNHPRLERYSGIGERIEAIEFHPAHDEAGRLIWESGIMATQEYPGQNVAQMALMYLFAHNGEMGHNCSLACTMGMVRVLQQVADDNIKARFLLPLLRDDYEQMEHAAQFLTEVQGGSDVGANTVKATPQPDGTWRINGEKWFCSNLNADQFLMTARVDEEKSGTRGLGLFVVPRQLDDGGTNGFYIRRLKDKLGTRTLASAELDFIDAVAYPVGPIEDGFKNVVTHVLNTSRLANAVSTTGIMRRAYIEAYTFACNRRAFGKSIMTYPMVQENLVDILTETVAGQASTFYVAHLLDRIETGDASQDEQKLYRLLVNANKYWTSIRATNAVHQAIEVLGGNGAIETFSVLPRLYRDMIVLESWEGTHNVLALQILRDCARYQLHESYFKIFGDMLTSIDQDMLLEDRDIVQAALGETAQMLEHLATTDDMTMQAHARRLTDRFITTAQAALMLQEAQWEIDNGFDTQKPDLIRHYVNRFIKSGYEPLEDDDFLARLRRLTQNI